MDTRSIMLTLRLIHIVGGVFWVGAMILVAAFLLPAVRAAGAQGGRVMQELTQQRRLPVYLSMAAGLTMLSGFTMYGLIAAGNGAWAGSRQGIAYGVGALAAIVAAILGGVVVGRTGRQLATLGERIQAAGGPPSAAQAAEMDALQARMGRTSRAVAALLLVTVAAMATARYL